MEKDNALLESNMYSPIGERSESIQGSNTIVYTCDQSEVEVVQDEKHYDQDFPPDGKASMRK